MGSLGRCLGEHLGGYSGGLGDGDDDDSKYRCEIRMEEKKRGEGGTYIALHHQCATRTGD